jgi:tryptophan-rich sensory protein
MEKKKHFKIEDWGALIISILLTEGIGYIASIFTRGSAIYYKGLIKPFFAPPAWVFGIVWPILYFLMAIAAYIIWVQGKKGKPVGKALALYITQLLLNFTWPFIFFRLNLYGIAFIEIVLLIIVVLLTIKEFFKHSKLSAIFMIPYILWLLYAAALNYYIWLLNEA